MLKQEINAAYKNDKEICRFIDDIQASFEEKGKVIFRERNIVKQFEASQSNSGGLDEFIVKKYKCPNFLQRIIYSFFRKSKAQKAYWNAKELRTRGVSTPIEIAYAEVWTKGLFETGYFVSLSNFDTAIRGQLIEHQPFDVNLAKAFGVFVASLHERGILHHDLNSTNVLYNKDASGYHFSLIDINRMKFYPIGILPKLEVCFDNLTRFCGDMQLFECVAQAYISARKLDSPNELLKLAIDIKKKHDEQWRRRKAFLRKFKRRRR